MENRTDEYLRNLGRQYLDHVRKFLEALKGNASQNELISIRKSTKNLFNEISKTSKTEDSFRSHNLS